MKDLRYNDLHTQELSFLKILQSNKNINFILRNIRFPFSYRWYLVGGCLNQTIWNYLTKREWNYGIGDYDIFYWDEDTSEEKEQKIQESINYQFKNLECEFDVVNQARVHLWFAKYFGEDMPGYSSLEQAVGSPPSTVTCIGVTKKNDKPIIFAPYGLSDIFSMTLRYNPETFIPDKFVIPKIEKWKSKWPELKEVANNYPRG